MRRIRGEEIGVAGDRQIGIPGIRGGSGRCLRVCGKRVGRRCGIGVVGAVSCAVSVHAGVRVLTALPARYSLEA